MVSRIEGTWNDTNFPSPLLLEFISYLARRSDWKLAINLARSIILLVLPGQIMSQLLLSGQVSFIVVGSYIMLSFFL